jgi:hypothetical protein
MTFTIVPAGAPAFLTVPPTGPFFAGLDFEYAVQTNESCELLLLTDADFLSLQDGLISGIMSAGSYHVNVQATSLASGLSAWQNFTLLVIEDKVAPEIVILGLSDGQCTNRTTLELLLTAADGEGSGGVNFWTKVNDEPWQDHGSGGRVVLQLQEGTSVVQVKAVDQVGNEAITSITVHIDTEAPSVLGYLPSGNDVATGQEIMVTFSKEMNASTVVVMVNGSPVPLRWEGNSAFGLPEGGWANRTKHDVQVDGQDLFGNPVETVSWSFRTGHALVWLNGTIMDAMGEPVANVTLRLLGKVVGVTDENGHFSLLVAPGKHELKVHKEGFKEKGVEVTIEPDLSMDMQVTVDWARGPLPWTIWVPIPLFLLEVLAIVLYRRRRP